LRQESPLRPGRLSRSAWQQRTSCRCTLSRRAWGRLGPRRSARSTPALLFCYHFFAFGVDCFFFFVREQDWHTWEDWFITHPVDGSGNVKSFRTWGHAAAQQPSLGNEQEEDGRAAQLRVKRTTGPFDKLVVDVVRKSMQRVAAAAASGQGLN